MPQGLLGHVGRRVTLATQARGAWRALSTCCALSSDQPAPPGLSSTLFQQTFINPQLCAASCQVPEAGDAPDVLALRLVGSLLQTTIATGEGHTLARSSPPPLLALGAL